MVEGELACKQVWNSILALSLLPFRFRLAPKWSPPSADLRNQYASWVQMWKRRNSRNSRCSTFLQSLFLDIPSLLMNLLLTSDTMIADKSKPLPSLSFLHHVAWYCRRVNVWHAPHGVWAQDVVLEEQQVRYGRRTIRGEVRLRQRALYIFGHYVSIAEDAKRRHNQPIQS
jgi:hypothetical protein